MPVEHVMGMPVRVEGDIDAARVFAWLRWVDATFSTYRPDSEISRLDRGELDEPHPLVRGVLARCEQLRRRDRRVLRRARRRPAGPSGYVKGWAVQRAAAFGRRRFLIDAGGDVLRPRLVARRHPAPVRARQAGRRDHGVGLRGGHLGRLRARPARHRPAHRPARERPVVGDGGGARPGDGGRLRHGGVRGRRPVLDGAARRPVDRGRAGLHDRDVASKRNAPGSTVQPPSQWASARGAIVTSTSTSSPGPASTTAKPASQRGGRSTALSGREA